MFVDSAGIAGPVVHRLRAMGYYNVEEVNYGAFAPDESTLTCGLYVGVQGLAVSGRNPERSQAGL